MKRWYFVYWQIFKQFFEKNLINFIETMLIDIIALKLKALSNNIRLKWVWIKLNILNSKGGLSRGEALETLENSFETDNENYWNLIIFSIIVPLIFHFDNTSEKYRVGAQAKPPPRVRSGITYAWWVSRYFFDRFRQKNLRIRVRFD